MKNKIKEEEITAKLPNVKFIGKTQRNGETMKAEPPAFVNQANGVIELPDGETQHAGFYHEKAGELIKLFPQWYKPLVPKG